MPPIFTFRWPGFARIEAAIFFPAAVLMVSHISLVLSATQRAVAAAIPPHGGHLTGPGQALVWVALGLITLVPYLGLLMAVDMLLGIRKGFAILAILATVVWTATAAALAHPLTGFPPVRLARELFGPSEIKAAAVAGGTLAFLFHFGPFWIGLQDQGFIAISLRKDQDDGPRKPNRRDQTEYAPASSGGVTVPGMVAWMCVVSFGAATYLYRDNVSAIIAKAYYVAALAR
jgi:hypothetical protein